MSASDRTFEIDGSIRLWADLGGHAVLVLVEATPTPAKKLIPGTAFAGIHVWCIEPDQWRVTSRREIKVSISVSSSTGTIGTINLDNRSRPYESVCKRAKMKTISSYSKFPVLATTSAVGTYVLETCRKDHIKSALLNAKNAVEVFPKQPVFVMVANMPK